MRKNQQHNATMSKQLSGFLKSKFHETNLIAFFNRIKKKTLYNISGWRKWNGSIQKSCLKDEFSRAGSKLCLSQGLKPGWKATSAAEGRRRTELPGRQWGSGRLLAGSEMGQYLQSIVINDLQEVTGRTLIKCAHVAKWEIGGETPERQAHNTQVLAFQPQCFGLSERSGLTLLPLPSPCCLGLEPDFCMVPQRKCQGRCLRSRLTNSLAKHQGV